MTMIRALLTVILTVNFSLTAIANCCLQTAHVGAMAASAVDHLGPSHGHSHDVQHDDGDCGKSGSHSPDNRLQAPLAETALVGPVASPIVIAWLIHSAERFTQNALALICPERPPDRVMTYRYLFAETDRLLV